MSNLKDTITRDLKKYRARFAARGARFEALCNLERAYRADTAARRPVPHAVHAAAFAITEAAEYMDALLRQHPQYVRNNDKPVDPVGELGDLIEMILTTAVTETPLELDEGERARWIQAGQLVVGLGNILVQLAATGRLTGDNHILGQQALELSEQLAASHDRDATAILQEKHVQGRAKWGVHTVACSQ